LPRAQPGVLDLLNRRAPIIGFLGQNTQSTQSQWLAAFLLRADSVIE
jgi:hypothetical protein